MVIFNLYDYSQYSAGLPTNVVRNGTTYTSIVNLKTSINLQSLS